MSKEIKKGAVPGLRFPEFGGAGEWEEKQIGSLFDLDYQSEKATSFNSEKVITVKLHTLGVVRNERTATLTGGANYFKRKSGQFIFSKIDLLNGAFGLVPEDLDGFVSSSDVPALNFLNSESARFFHYWMVSNYKGLAIERTGTSRTLKRVSKQSFLELSILLPDVAEQQKIAACLSSLDELIAAEVEAGEALKAHKRGLMQGLFPREGETVPRVRFAGFEGEWAVKPFDEVATFSKGKGISKSDVVENGRLPCIRYGELYTRYGETISSVYSHTNLQPDGLVLSQANDVIIPASGETQEDIATASCVLQSGVALGGDLNIIRSSMNGVFLSLYLNNAKKKEIAQLAQGISVVHLYPNQLKKLIIHIPSFEEQQKIADTLSSLDDLIAAQAQKIEALKEHKRGLMQGLFPSTSNGAGE